MPSTHSLLEANDNQRSPLYGTLKIVELTQPGGCSPKGYGCAKLEGGKASVTGKCLERDAPEPNQCLAYVGTTVCEYLHESDKKNDRAWREAPEVCAIGDKILNCRGILNSSTCDSDQLVQCGK